MNESIYINTKNVIHSCQPPQYLQ